MSTQIFIISLISAAAICAVATPAFAALARRTGLVVRPRADRWHRQPTPLLGGAAIALAIILVLGPALPDRPGSWVILAGAAAAFTLGLLDDIRHIAPTTKLVGQALVGSLLVVGGIQVGITEIAPLAFMMTIFWTVAIMNALNLMDNMDGLAAGVTVIAALVLGITSRLDDPRIALASGATAGAALGFLAHNFHPARVFMGDAGSMLLGFLLAATALLHTAGPAANVGFAVLGPILVLAIPIFDTAFVTAARRIAGRSISRGGRDHVSHRLVALGLSDRYAVLMLYGVAAAFAVLAATIERIDVAIPILALAGVALVLFGVFLAEVNVYGPTPDSTVEKPRSPVLGALSVYGRFGIEVGLDVVLLTVAYYLAHVFRFEGMPDAVWRNQFVISVPIVIAVQLSAMVVLRAYRILWRYLGIGDAVYILRATTLGTAAAALAILLIFRFENFSRAVFIFDWLLASFLIITSRSFGLVLRHWFSSMPRSDARRVLIVGATAGGSTALRLLTTAEHQRYQAVGFVDDDPGKRHRHVGGVAIVGTTEELEALIARLRVDLVVLALDRQSGSLDQARATCEKLGIETREFFAPV